MGEDEDARWTESWWIVLRAAPGVPVGSLAPKLAETWFDVGVEPPPRFPLGGLVAVATERYETRSDGVRAQVYEIRPARGDGGGEA